MARVGKRAHKINDVGTENDVENALTTYCHEHDVVISIQPYGCNL